jgi:hypothetical protein
VTTTVVFTELNWKYLKGKILAACYSCYHLIPSTQGLDSHKKRVSFIPFPTLHKLQHIYSNSRLATSFRLPTSVNTVVIMKAVILVLLLVAGTLVHNTPLEGGKSL